MPPLRPKRVAMLALMSVIALLLATMLLPTPPQHTREESGPITAIVFAQTPPNVKLPPATLVAWTYLPNIDLDKVAKAIEELGGYIVTKSDEKVEGAFTLSNLEKLDSHLANLMKTEVRIVAYKDGLMLAYTPAFSPDGLAHVIYVREKRGSTPIVVPIVYAALRMVADKIGVSLGDVYYGTTQYSNAKAMYILWSDYAGVKSDYYGPTIEGSFSVPEGKEVLAGGLAIAYYCNWGSEYGLEIKFDGRRIYYRYYIPCHHYKGIDITSRAKPGDHKVEVYFEDTWGGGWILLMIVLVTN